MRHASFFSGVGGLDLGFERAGIQTISVSEVEPYACSVLAERFPGAPNLGDITKIKKEDIPYAEVWSGGFPCQDLSWAGKRRGFSGERSVLALTFLDLVEQRRPRWIVLENVQGIFSTSEGRDFGTLIAEMDKLGYGVAWRTLDARYFGVPQRRRRVFIVGSLGSERAAEVLFECEGSCGHYQASGSSWATSAGQVADGSGIAGTILARSWKGVSSTIDNHLVVGTPVDSDGVRAADGLARRVDNREELEETLTFPSRLGSNAKITSGQAQAFAHSAGAPAVLQSGVSVSANAEPGTDMHRYRCCGNGVVANVAEWIGRRLVAVNSKWHEEVR